MSRARAVADVLRLVLVVSVPLVAIVEDPRTAVGVAAGAAIALAVRVARPPGGLDLAFVALLTTDLFLTAFGVMAEINREDRVGHLVLPAAVTPLLVFAAVRAGTIDPRGHPVGLWLVGGALGTALGAVWEVCEWASDAWLGTMMSLSKDDTIGDLACDTAGSLLAAAVLAVAVARGSGVLDTTRQRTATPGEVRSP